MAKLVSKVYGDALFEVAVESGRLDEIWEQTRAMQTALEENPELFALMRHPKIVKEEKVKRPYCLRVREIQPYSERVFVRSEHELPKRQKKIV